MPSDNWEVVEGFKVTVGVGVADQPVLNRTVSVAKVFSAGPGWIVIHAQMDGKPGPLFGQRPVVDGSNANVVVEIDTANVTGTLYAMLHNDAGTLGLYEFPGSDMPVEAAGYVITPAFRVIGATFRVARSGWPSRGLAAGPSGAGRARSLRSPCYYGSA